MEGEVVEGEGVEVIEGAEGALCEGVGTEAEVDFPGADGGEFGSEESVCGCEGFVWTETGQSGEDDVCGGVDARVGEGEDALEGRVRVEGEAEAEEEGDGAEENV